MKAILFVFVGGGLGSVLRYMAGKWLAGYFISSFPLVTLAVNVVACAVLGFIVGWSGNAALSANTRLFLTVGFCGGFSTFSAFSQETITLLQGGQNVNAILYVMLSVVLCLGASFAGLYFGSR